VPASPWDPRGLGNLRLLRSGAKVCVRPADVLSESAPGGGSDESSRRKKPRETSDLSDLSQPEQAILHNLAGRARHPDEVCQRTGIPAFRVQQSILRLLVRGLIEEKPGGRYQSCRAGEKPY
jgi:predicted Rossmann fold nucleotide-binding protein DprA/Smf involved in DNA uptake